MPENVYFRQPATQKILLDILFIYSKLNPDTCYRQGMHELLAPILWVVERDSLDSSATTSDTSSELEVLLSDKYIEHDTFGLFVLIMKTAKSFYEPATNSRPTRSRSVVSAQRESQQESPILQRCYSIVGELLPKVDPELAEHLRSIEIMPQIFLMRWLRLLFGREFPFDELLDVWDLLFAEDPSLELVDYICVSMLLRIRWQLLPADANEALTLLLRYPSPVAPHPPSTFVEDAILLKNRPSVEAGHQIVLKYSGRAPRRVSTSIYRPSTPQSSRDDSTSRSPRFPSPFGSPSSSTLESVFQNVANSMLARGGQAVRDAMGEVRKNVQTFQSGRSSPLAKSLPVVGGPLGHRAKRSDASSTIAANVLRRMNALDERNKRLAKMLEVAVSDLREYQNASPEKGTPESLSEKLSVAIAKVQFVQVYLSDSSLLLPADDNKDTIQNSAESETSTTSSVDATQSTRNDEHVPAEARPKGEEQLNLHKDGKETEHDTTQTSTTQVPIPAVSVPKPSPAVSALSQALSSSPKGSLTGSHRPALSQSTFSYMLGQAHEDPSSSFLSASPLTPNERRNRGGTDKAFLFGDEEDVESDQSSAKGKPRTKSKAKAKGVTAQGEDIDLGDLTGTPDGD